MTGYDPQKGDLLATADEIYQVGVTDGVAAQQAADAPTIATLKATVATLTADEAADEQQIANLKAQIAILEQGNTTPPPVLGSYGGTTGWGAPLVVDLTKAPAGTTYTNGPRASTDSSTNREAQAKYGPDGLTVVAARSGSTIFSADVMFRGVKMTAPWAIEADIEMKGLGAGMGPAFWARATNGSGEIDFMEYLGSNTGKGIAGGKGKFESKVTLINTGSNPYAVGQDANGIPPGEDGSYEGLRRYRAELVDGMFSEWVDGQLVWQETQAAFEKIKGNAGLWKQFAVGTEYYPRLTFQVGNGTSSKLWGAVPASWQTSSIRLGALRVYSRA